MNPKSRPSFTANSPTLSSESRDPFDGVSPKAVAALKRILIERLRWEETVSLGNLADQLSRRFKLNWSDHDFALLRNAMTTVAKITGLALWVCVEEPDGLPLREFFEHEARSGNLTGCETLEEQLEFWHSEFERLCAEVRRMPAPRRPESPWGRRERGNGDIKNVF